MKKVLVAGCSFSDHCGFTKENHDKYHFTSLLKNEFNWDITNIAEPGMSNYEIFKRTIKEILINKYDLVLIQWSVLHRLWVYKKEHNIDTPTKVNSIATDWYVQDLLKINTTYLNNDYVGIEEFLLLIKSLSEMCLSRNVPFVMSSGFNNFFVDLRNYSTSRMEYLDIPQVLLDLVDFGDNSTLEKIIHSKINDLIFLFNEIQYCNYVKPGLYALMDNKLDVSDDNRHPGVNSNKLYASKIRLKLIELGYENDNNR